MGFDKKVKEVQQRGERYLEVVLNLQLHLALMWSRRESSSDWIQLYDHFTTAIR